MGPVSRRADPLQYGKTFRPGSWIFRQKDFLGASAFRWRVVVPVLFLVGSGFVRPALAESPVPVTLGQSVMNLNGPWKFHLGDDPSWADPDFDDSTWESVDLTAPPGAHDEDVGLTGYVPGWGARGHLGYSGYAWYRLRVLVSEPGKEPLALTGPPAVDSAYQVFVNGKLLGSAGRFSRQTPTVFSIQPRIFVIPRSLVAGDGIHPTVMAFRVWMGPWDLADPSAGGIRIAPALGETQSIDLIYQIQWLQTVRGYIVEVVEAVAFVLLAVMTCILIALARSRTVYIWLVLALVLTAFYRANQAVFFWGQFETIHDFELVSEVLLIPSCLAAWTLAWHGWFLAPGNGWMVRGVLGLTLLYVLAQCLTCSWFYGILPSWATTASEFVIIWTRWLFVGLTAFIVYRGIGRQGTAGWIILPAVILVSVGQFAPELSGLGIQSIWFPFGTGVSRTQFAYAAFDMVLFGLLLRRLLIVNRHARSVVCDAPNRGNA